MRMFATFWGGGFECSTHRHWGGRRLDLLESTGHVRHAAHDYAALKALGLGWARDGLRWPLVERRSGPRDWSSWRPMLDAASAANLAVAWDLFHFGFPDWLDVFDPCLPVRVAGYAAEATRMHRAATGRPGIFCPINEASFMAFAGGDVAWMAPMARGRGVALKEALTRAAIAMARAIRAEEPATTLLWAEPLIAVVPRGPDAVETAERQHASQYEFYDWLLGRTRLELGGGPDCADLLGFNHYPHCVWWHDGATIALGTCAHRPLSGLITEAAARYPGTRLFLSETGAEGAGRAPWLHYVAQECAAALAQGAPVVGACLYPVTDYPGWDDDRHCPTGALGYPDDAGVRPVHGPSAAALAATEPGLRAAREATCRPAAAADPRSPP
jgi:hypothetical protein